jgi:hypothetical protein
MRLLSAILIAALTYAATAAAGCSDRSGSTASVSGIDFTASKRSRRVNPASKAENRDVKVTAEAPSVVRQASRLARPTSYLKPAGKGIGLSFVKSLVNLKGCAAGIKIPVSGQFKSWDSNQYLPKVNSFVGVQYPLGCSHWFLPVRSRAHRYTLIGIDHGFVSMHVIYILPCSQHSQH